ncbi:MAG: glycerophosphodiester phosphodiesterase family protein [Ruminococcaceae bacterium]|nr:glycerophosphodiester phosphodiesterase family protein [Oscillospiraceae bacterium]
MIDFSKSIFENRKAKGSPFLAAHRGVCGANVPCNTLASYKIALDLGADVVEIDVSKSKDGVFYAFHPWMEPVFLKSKYICDLTSQEVDELFLLNSDSVPTSYRVPRLRDVLMLLKDKAYINVDKFWTDVEGITREIRECGVEKQVIVKTGTDKETLERVKEFAPDFMFMPLVKHKDDVTDYLQENGINQIGTEILFDSEDNDCISDEYIAKMHDKGLLVWANAIIYNEKDVISAHHTDDISLYDNPDKGWGWLIDKGVDFIQTDWLVLLQNYIEKRK